VGVEPFREDFQSAQTKGLEVINCSAEDAMTQIKERFEFIVFADVLEHLQDPAAVLESCHGLLKPKGKIIISIPNNAKSNQTPANEKPKKMEKPKEMIEWEKKNKGKKITDGRTGI
jgi:2-polyprenyl-3-methyl-5-hydroxy-6-metoxy-1,4-benzoquinol methylase